MKILFAASEVVPFAKTGGLADVAASLPSALKALGHDVRVIMPRYRSVGKAGIPIKEMGKKVAIRVGDEIHPGSLALAELPSGVPVYLVGYDPYFDREGLYGSGRGDYPDNASRFIFFSRAVLEAVKTLDFVPDILHLNDWQTALAALYLKTGRGPAFSHEIASVFTIHNLGYQGLFARGEMPLTGLGWDLFTPRGIEFYGKINFLKAGLIAADRITTVSRRYAEEIRTPEYGSGLEGVLQERSRDLVGIINGVDYSCWDPKTDPLIPARYSPDALDGKAVCKRALKKEFGLKGPQSRPLIGCVSRLTDQKGFDLIVESAEKLSIMDLSLVVLGDGEERYRKGLAALVDAFPDRFGLRVGYNDSLAHLIEAGADFFLMPSRYEPCGLNQMYSLKYGTVPIVRATGGLDDTILSFDTGTGFGNGFKFSDYSSAALLKTLQEALAVYRIPAAWKRLRANAMACDFSWERSAREYVGLYEELLKDLSNPSGRDREDSNVLQGR
ncbi:MAG: glycogen synthase GlgA [Deltaproteobacteria bacterium]|nr:glycogen synthase GlgA [Deltaproteobacteria bacterium]